MYINNQDFTEKPARKGLTPKNLPNSPKNDGLHGHFKGSFQGNPEAFQVRSGGFRWCFNEEREFQGLYNSITGVSGLFQRYLTRLIPHP